MCAADGDCIVQEGKRGDSEAPQAARRIVVKAPGRGKQQCMAPRESGSAACRKSAPAERCLPRMPRGVS